LIRISVQKWAQKELRPAQLIKEPKEAEICKENLMASFIESTVQKLAGKELHPA
jgi:hypothetical protein